MLRALFITVITLGLLAPVAAYAAPVDAAVVRAGAAADAAERVRRADAALKGLGSERDRALARVVRGMARVEQGAWAEAADDLLTAARAPIAARDFALFHGAEARFHQGRYAEAQRLYARLLKRYPQSVWRHRARFRLADCDHGRGRLRQASKGWAKADETYPEFPHQVALGFARAEAERQRDRRKAAADRLRGLIKLYPNDPLTKTARERLAQLEAEGARPPARSPAEIYRTGTSLRRRKYFEQALTAFQGLLTHGKANGGLKRRARLQIGRTLLQMERHAESVATFEQLETDSARVPAWQRRASYWKSRALRRMGRLKEAAKAFMNAQPDPENLTNEAELKLAELYFHGGGYKAAASKFLALVKKRAGNLRWFMAWSNWRLGRYEEARNAFLRMRRGSRYNRARYAYWAARAHAQLGEFEAAQGLYLRIIETVPGSYYAWQARARLTEMGRPPAPLYANPCQEKTCDPSGPSTDAVTPLGALAQRHPDVPGLVEAYELAVLGETRQAMWRLRAVRDERLAWSRAGRPGGWRYVFKPYVDNRKDEERAEWARPLKDDDPPRRSSAQLKAMRDATRDKAYRPQLREAFSALGDWHYVRRMSYNKSDKVVEPPEEPANNAKWRQRYGRAYRPIIEAKAEKYGLDPLLLWAFMTVESAYNPWALSRVGARGLMQVMPHTGALIGDRMKWRNFGTALLFEPEIAIEMGAWYVYQLLTKFDGQLPLAIAGYNAGPHRVAAWLDAKGHLPMDEFIEEIPYTEARNYTKKVLRHLMLYRRIYEGRSDWPVSQVIDPRYRDNINF